MNLLPFFQKLPTIPELKEGERTEGNRKAIRSKEEKKNVEA